MVYPSSSLPDLRVVVEKDEVRMYSKVDQETMEELLEEVQKQAGIQTYQELIEMYPEGRAGWEKERELLASLYESEAIVEEGENPMSESEWEGILWWLDNRNPESVWDETPC